MLGVDHDVLGSSRGSRVFTSATRTPVPLRYEYHESVSCATTSCAVRNRTIQPPKEAVIRDLITEWIGPVRAPAYLKSVGVRAPADLARVRVLATKTRPQAWADWLATSGNTVELRTHESFEHFYLLIQAAVCGLGVAVVPHMLVIDDLRSGKLVAPFGFLPGPRKLLLWVAPHLASRQEIQALESWLATQMRDSLRGVTKAPNPESRNRSRRAR